MLSELVIHVRVKNVRLESSFKPCKAILRYTSFVHAGGANFLEHSVFGRANVFYFHGVLPSAKVYGKSYRCVFMRLQDRSACAGENGLMVILHYTIFGRAGGANLSEHKTFRTLWRSRTRHGIEMFSTSMACPPAPKRTESLMHAFSCTCSYKFAPPARTKLV